MTLLSHAHTLLAVASTRGSAKALITWPKFSVTSFLMVSKLVKQGIRARTVIDVGANTGQFAVAAARLFHPTQLYAFEPVPESFVRLQHALRHDKSATVRQLACGERMGTIPMHVNSHSHSSSVLRLGRRHREAFPNADEVASISVPLTTLDNALGSIQFESPTLLKIDVQGYESQVVTGASMLLARVEFVLLEASLKPLYENEPIFRDLEAQLASLGFDFLRPVGMLEDPKTGEILQMDCLFGRRGC